MHTQTYMYTQSHRSDELLIIAKLQRCVLTQLCLAIIVQPSLYKAVSYKKIQQAIEPSHTFSEPHDMVMGQGQGPSGQSITAANIV